MLQLFKGKEIEPAYYPNNIGGLRPAGEFEYEFLLVGKDIPGAQFMVINAFLQHYVKILSFKSHVDPGRKQFSLTLLCDLEDSDLPPNQLVNTIRSLKFVTTLESYEMKGRIFGRAFPLTFYDKRRVVALSSATLIKLAIRLAKETGASATSALYEEGREYAKEVIDELQQLLKGEATGETSLSGNYESEQFSLQAYCVKCKTQREIEEPKQVMLKNNKPAMQGTCPVCGIKVFKIGFRAPHAIRNSPLIENMQGFLMAAGWGTFELRSEIAGRSGEVSILDPPTFEGDIIYGNQFLEGVAAGFLEKITGTNNKMKLVGEKYYSKRRVLSLHFAQEVPIVEPVSHPKEVRERKRLSQRSVTMLPETTAVNPTQDSKVLDQEVERIIQSLEEIEASSIQPASQKFARNEEPKEIVVQKESVQN
jgi:Domain of unknown function (DUF5679)